MHAWYKLTTSDMGPRTRCLGDNVPPPQAFQTPLPSGPTTLPDFISVRDKIQSLIDDNKSNRGAFIDLAVKCASTFRATDYDGGCNGAFIRFEDSSSSTMSTLEEVKTDYPDASYADLIVLAGQVALEDAGSKSMSFCGGRVDAESASIRDHLKPIVYDSRLSAAVVIKDSMVVKGLTFRQGVGLAGIPTGSDDLSNKFFVDLIAAADNKSQGSFTDDEYALVQDNELKSIIKLFAESEGEFKMELASAFEYLVTADRFDGPRTNACAGVSTPTINIDGKASMGGLNRTGIALVSVFVTLGVVGIAAFVIVKFVQKGTDNAERAL